MKELEDAAKERSLSRATEVEKNLQTPITSTTVIPKEFFKKLQKTENLVNHLKHENKSQREELAELKLSLDQDSRLRYRGCNHPGRKQNRSLAEGQQRSSSLVRMESQKNGRLPSLKSRINRFFNTSLFRTEPVHFIGNPVYKQKALVLRLFPV